MRHTNCYVSACNVTRLTFVRKYATCIPYVGNITQSLIVRLSVLRRLLLDSCNLSTVNNHCEGDRTRTQMCGPGDRRNPRSTS